MKFMHRFNDTLMARVEMPDEVPIKHAYPNQPLNIGPKVEWTGEPGPGHVRQYIAWMNSVLKVCSDKWDEKIMHFYQVDKTGVEGWLFEPGKRPKRVEKFHTDGRRA